MASMSISTRAKGIQGRGKRARASGPWPHLDFTVPAAPIEGRVGACWVRASAAARPSDRSVGAG